MIDNTYDLKWFCDAIKNKDNFSFSRWGDGEWNCLLRIKGKHQTNCDGHRYFIKMGDRLKDILKLSPNYLIGLQNLAYKQATKTNHINRYTEEYGLKWIDADIFHHASMNHEINQFFEVLQEREVLLVGPEHLKKFHKFKFSFYQIPSKNCWLEYENIKNDLYKHINNADNIVVVFCASMMANILIDDFSDTTNTLIDFGSVLDPYVGKISRNYHKTLRIED